MECHPVRHVYRVDIREVWPSSWMTHGAHSEAVSCDYMGSELAYTCSHLWGDLLALKDKQNNKITKTHKEEAPCRIARDYQIVRRSKNLFKLYRSPCHRHTPTRLLNVVAGPHATVNEDESINIEREHMSELESGWPTSFNKTLTKNVALMTSTKKSIKLDGKPVYDKELVFTRAMCIQQCCDIDLQMSSPTNVPQCQHHYLMRVVLCMLSRRQS